MKCEVCKETYNYEDEMTHYNINGHYSDMREEATQNPDNKAYTVCNCCDEELGGFEGVQKVLGKR